jgi:hypothetical protein
MLRGVAGAPQECCTRALLVSEAKRAVDQSFHEPLETHRNLNQLTNQDKLPSLEFIIYVPALGWNPNSLLALIISVTVDGTISCHETLPI